MSTGPQDEQHFEWSNALRTMAELLAPPAWLEQRVVSSLRERRFLRQKPPARWLRAIVIAAACVLCFVTGLFLSSLEFSRRSEREQPHYILLLFRGAGTPAPDSKEEAGLVQEYSRWARNELSVGHILGGEKLNDASVEIFGSQGQQTLKPDNQLGGYFVIAAPDLNAAVAIARTCPHLEHGGSIVIRPIDQTSSRQ